MTKLRMQLDSSLPRVQLENLYHLLEEQNSRRDVHLIDAIQDQRKLGFLTAETVANFAFLTVQDDVSLQPITPAAHHWLWLELLTDLAIKRLLIISPPESAKTTWLISYLACSIGFAPEDPRILSSVSGDVAEKRSISVRNVIESDVFKEIFPGVKRAKGMPYNQEEWSVALDGRPRPGRLHPTLFAAGTGGTVIGSRAKEAVCDDLLDFDSTRTKHQRDLVHIWLHNSFFSRVMARVGRITVIGTSWHHDDAYSRMRGDGDFVVCHLPILSESEQVYANLYYPLNTEAEPIGTLIGQAKATGDYQDAEG